PVLDKKDCTSLSTGDSFLGFTNINYFLCPVFSKCRGASSIYFSSLSSGIFYVSSIIQKIVSSPAGSPAFYCIAYFTFYWTCIFYSCPISFKGIIRFCYWNHFVSISITYNNREVHLKNSWFSFLFTWKANLSLVTGKNNQIFTQI